ncbi:MAG: type II secretion system ATPase GspE [Nitrospira sp.]|nr:type II secretion system ATPase GspE [bacterium]MBL7049510.1 type II secretion system ATPase GspE [Nitrospira sp.]
MENIATIKDEDIDFSILNNVPLSYVKNNLFLPIRKEKDHLIGAVAGKSGIYALRDLARSFDLKPLPLQADKEIILDAINRIYSQASKVDEVMGDIKGEDLSMIATEFESPRDLLELTEEAPIIRLLNAVLMEAVKEKASDIHIEPYENGIDVRFRVDGILNKVLSPPKIIHDALISRIKIIADLDIAEKRLPQDGRIKLLVGGKNVDIRVSIIPTALGERAVLRLLDRQSNVITLEMLGMSESTILELRTSLSRQNGIILVTGPTGSGKTTTLYASLLKLNTEDRNIITVEDPVEYQLRGIGQMQVNPKIGLTFAAGLRSILRQDPDIMMVGEIRDMETAEIAVHASLTGHLVLSTLHTNDAPSAITRLIDMGIEPFLVASSFVCVMAQRLVRKLCPDCKESYIPSKQELDFLNTRESLTLYRSKGCDKCIGKGYIGRTGIYELLQITPGVRAMITAGTDAQAIKAEAIKSGFKPLHANAIEKVLQGITTIEEVLRVTQQDLETQ